MKYENIDLIDALRRISDIHTEHYKEDFELDQKLIRDLAATHSAEDKHLLWMSRPHGTHIMREREVYIEDTYEKKHGSSTVTRPAILSLRTPLKLPVLRTGLLLAT